MQDKPAEPMRGGRTTLGVVKIGETVRRPVTPNSAFVRSLLAHLERFEFTGVPRFLGLDDEDRDILTYLAGDVPTELGEHSDLVLEAAAKLIRGFHDATATLVNTDAAAQSGIEVVCHNDLSPCNTVFRAGIPMALIDFDEACPGTRAFDLGYAAWLWLDWGNPEWSAAHQLSRLRTFLAAYGPGPTEPAVIASAIQRQAIVTAEGLRTGNQRMADWALDCRQWTLSQLA